MLVARRGSPEKASQEDDTVYYFALRSFKEDDFNADLDCEIPKTLAYYI